MKSRKLISQVFKEGKTIVSGPFRILYTLTSPSFSQQLQAGFSVSKRNFKKAADRNRIKRLMREAYRVHKPVTGETSIQMLAIFIIYTGKTLPDFHFTQEKISAAMHTLNTRMQQNTPSS